MFQTKSKWLLLENLGESSDVESEEEEDDISTSSASQDEALDGGNKPVKHGSKVPDQNKQAKPRDDLAMYEKFFPELFEFQVGLMTNLVPRIFLHCFPLSLEEIVLPTTKGCRGERAWERGLLTEIFVTVQ